MAELRTRPELHTGPESLTLLRRRLIRWYRTHARDLPWRRSRDPYRVWVSEIMLQQTTVAAVIPYFERFLGRFPHIESLAAAPEKDVLKLWEGLGYYSRARNLHAAARHIVDKCAGSVPRDVTELILLPGIGRYTAGAIASLAYNRRSPIVEANTLRVYARLLALRGDPSSTNFRNRIWSFAAEAVPPRSAASFNQALMDLGATICTPAEPNCPECPLRACCQAFCDGSQREIPEAKRRPETTYLTQAMVAVRKRGNYLLRRSPLGERWAGLWEFLRIDLDSNADPNGAQLKGNEGKRSRPSRECVLFSRTRQRLEEAVAARCGLMVDVNRLASEMQHSVTRFRIRLICATAECQGGRLNGSEFRWTPPPQFHEHAFSRPSRKFSDRLLAEHDATGAIDEPTSRRKPGGRSSR